MMVPGFVFAGVFLTVFGAYWFFVMRDENRMLARLRPGRGPRSHRRPNVLRPEDTMSSVGTLNALLLRVHGSGPVQRLLDQAGVHMTVSVFLLASGCLALVAFLAGTLVTRFLLVGLALGAVAGSGPYVYVRWRREKRIRKFEEQFPEAIEFVARALRAGHSLPTGLGMVADELSAPVGTEFRILFDEQNFGLTLPHALRNFARRVPMLDARFFVTAVLTQREAGGNLAEVLDNLGAVIRERFKVRRQVQVLSAHGRITGWVLGLLPPSLALATFVVNPGHLGSLVSDPLGRRMILGAVVLQVLGMLAIRKLVDIEY